MANPLSRTRTREEVDTAMRRICAGEVRRCIPAQIDDDDVVLEDVVEEWEQLRGVIEQMREALSGLDVSVGHKPLHVLRAVQLVAAQLRAVIGGTRG